MKERAEYQPKKLNQDQGNLEGNKSQGSPVPPKTDGLETTMEME